MVHYQKALEIKPDYAEAHDNLGIALVERGRSDEAIAHFRRHWKSSPTTPRPTTTSASPWRARTDRRGDRALPKGPGNQARLRRGPQQPRRRFGGAADGSTRRSRNTKKALEIKPDYAEARNNLGLALAGCGRIDEAIAQSKRPWKSSPTTPRRIQPRPALAGGGRIDEAIAHYQKALEIQPGNAEAHNNLGLALAGCGRKDEAIGHLKKALEIKPDYAEAHFNLGHCFGGPRPDRRGDRALPAGPENQAQLRRGLQQPGRGLGGPRTDRRSDGTYQKALKIEPDNAEAHSNLGVVSGGSAAGSTRR